MDAVLPQGRNDKVRALENNGQGDQDAKEEEEELGCVSGESPGFTCRYATRY